MILINQKLLATVILAISLSSCGTFGPESLIRIHTYDGPIRSTSNLATVFATLDGIGGEFTYICEVDGKNYRRFGSISSCPSIVYTTPGEHQLKIEYRSVIVNAGVSSWFGEKTFPIKTEPGKVYEVKATSTDKKIAHYSVREMPPSFVLTYKDVARGVFFNQEDRLNLPVPLTPN